MRLKIFRLAMINMVTIVLLSSLWEFGLEKHVLGVLGLDYDAGFETSERLRFILTSTVFAGLAMIIPGLLIAGLMRKSIAAEKSALLLAGTDELTGTGNRRAFSVRLAELDAGGTPYTLTLIDVNDFKSINDLHGHQQGDAVLITLARLLTAFAGPETQVFRIGGDEFAITSGHCYTDEAIETAQNLLRRAAGIRTGPGMFLSLSVGVASPACSAGYDIVRAADLAMYEAKRDTAHPVVRFTLGLEQRFRRRERLQNDVAMAVRNNDIVPFLQPLVCLKTGRIRGFEILARWINASGRAVAPDVFLPVVEKLGLMDTLTARLLEAVVPLTPGWPAGLHLALNITPEQLLKPALTACVSRIMQRAGPVRLEIEITEQHVMMISEDARRAILTLKESGIGVVLDDFGTGYSNLSVLLGLGINHIKIDRSFISDFINSPRKERVVETLLQLCKDLGVTVTAEGIENTATLEWLRRRGCDYGQGYLFSQPVPAEHAAGLTASGLAADLCSGSILPAQPGFIACGDLPGRDFHEKKLPL
ncbi:putative bifunctional diguanylate cyclase/phosphodiesterase [Pantoea agglomerans]|uniref:putative bifunctional diguanylate cyclase/phosphodiesterase n=1 Tax=Enterobacter agglomerans TaxID=549 RepID=UPI0028A1CA98|nr:bifunctional diguanylate cyclase/phosphodiesterase [Pantoea agglomerans]WNK42332.1 bifunctional diguanylate cyclase/phosphodiesterase [Pantoea agglomerans]WNK51289.1 bifunctional diguanylate cyclase/phosphodiesterase [Pantoea agglomerans]